MTTKGSRLRRARAKTFTRSHPKAIAAAKHSHTDAGPDQVICLLCGKAFRAVNAFHLRAKHGLEGKHPVRAYKERFGLRIAMCEESQERLREVQIDYHTREGRHLSREQVLARIRRIARRGGSLARARVPFGLSNSGIRIFGSWDDALRAAGEDPLDHRLLGGWTREAIIKRIREVAVDAPMTDRRAFSEHQRLYGLAMGEFGAWSRALEAAGLDPGDHLDARFWTLEKAEGWVREQSANGESFRASDTPGGVVQFIARETGQTWVEYVESLGLPYPPYARHEPWTDDEVIHGIHARRRRGAPVNRKGVERDEPALVRQGTERFGSWDAALTAAGIDPTQVRLKRPWTRQDVIQAIQARHAQGLRLDQRAVTAEDRRIVVAAGKLWSKPLPWLQALRAAGLNPNDVYDGSAPWPRTGRQRRHK